MAEHAGISAQEQRCGLAYRPRRPARQPGYSGLNIGRAADLNRRSALRALRPYGAPWIFLVPREVPRLGFRRGLNDSTTPWLGKQFRAMNRGVAKSHFSPREITLRHARITGVCPGIFRNLLL